MAWNEKSGKLLLELMVTNQNIYELPGLNELINSSEIRKQMTSDIQLGDIQCKIYEHL